MFSKKLSDSILRICDSQQLSYETASELCDLSPRYFGSIARGQTAPSINTLEKICVGLHRTPNELLGVSSAGEELSYRVAMLVIHYREAPLFRGGHTTFPVCPRCQNSLEREYQAFCEHCGQKLGAGSFSAMPRGVQPAGGKSASCAPGASRRSSSSSA